MTADTMSVNDAAAKLGVSAGTVRKLIDEGRLRGIRLGATHLLVPTSAVEAFLNGLPEPGPAIDGALLAGVRQYRGRTVKQVAKAVGLDPAVVEAAEAGDIRLARPLVEKVAAFLDVPLVAVVADSEVGS